MKYYENKREDQKIRYKESNYQKQEYSIIRYNESNRKV